MVLLLTFMERLDATIFIPTEIKPTGLPIDRVLRHRSNIFTLKSYVDSKQNRGDQLPFTF